MRAIFNDWAKRPAKSGRRHTATFEVASDASAVLVLMRRESGELMRLNFSKVEASRLGTEIRDAASLPAYGDMARMDAQMKGGAA